MPRDIRSYFSAGATAKKPSVISDDSPKKSSISERSKVVGGKKTKHVILDSDSEEDPLPPSPKRRKSSSGSGKKESIIKKETSNLVPVNIADVFGGKPIERVVKPSQEKRVSSVQHKGEHSRDDKSSASLGVSNESSNSDFCVNKIDERLQTEIKSPEKVIKIKVEEEDGSKGNLKHYEESKKRSDGDRGKKRERGHSEKTPSKTSDLVKREGSEIKEHSEREGKSSVDGGSSEKKKQHAIMYQKYLHREGPKHRGSKEIPKGHPNCLNGLVFVITGVLDSMEREDAVSLIQRCGGKATQSVSRNTSYIVLGDEPGPAKLEKARSLGIKELDEDGLLDLIKSRANEEGSITAESAESPSGGKKRPKQESKESLPIKAPKVSKVSEDGVARKLHYTAQDLPSHSGRSLSDGDTSVHLQKDTSEMWVDKYKPANTKQIIGQQGEKSNVNKLKRWLSNWHKYHGKGGSRPPRPGPWDKNDDGGYYKAALLSGPPGIGKTTSAHLVCEELGMDAIEMNASDTRSKKLLEQEVAELVTNQTLSSFFTLGDKHSAKSANTGKKKVLLMDEVDGMAGNEDRGGIAALIQLIKESCIPIICMCNDRAHPKIRSLVGHCYDLRYQRPRMEQIRGAMMSICFKEGLKVSPDALGDLITSTNQDVRQVLHQLNMWAADKNGTHKSVAGSRMKGLKDVRLGPWDVLRKVFSAEERKNTDILKQTELFFYDYNLGPLFVFQNYPKVSPNSARNMKQKLSLLAQTAESIAKGDIIQRVIRRENAWKLLPAQAIFSSVLPGYLLEGHLTAQIDFPAHLGKTSTKGKMERLLQEVTLHAKTTTRTTKEAMKQDYLSYLRDAIVRPLIEESRGESAAGEGVHKAIDVMHGYSFLREDLDSILELTHFPGSPDPMSSIQPKVKAAFTRTYNKEGMMTPYAVTMNVKKKRRGGDEYGSEEEEEEDEEDDEDPLVDAMIKVKKPSGRGNARGGSCKEEKKGDEGGKRGRGRGKRGK